MSEIMALREQIKETLTELGLYRSTGRYVLSCTMDEYDTEEWTVEFRVSLDSRLYVPIGVGETPESAYRDMLRNCALMITGPGLQVVYDGE